MTIVRGRRSKKKIFGRKRASYDARLDQIVSNDKRVPHNIQIVENKAEEVVTPAMDVSGKMGEKGVKGRGRSGRFTVGERYGDTVLSSLTLPTVATTGDNSLVVDNFESNGGGEQPSNSLVNKTISTSTMQTTGHGLSECKVENDKITTNVIIRSKQQLASTKKRLTYGIRETMDVTTSNQDATMILADKSVCTVPKVEMNAVTTSRTRSLRTANTTSIKRKSDTATEHITSSSQPLRSMMCGNPSRERKVFGDKTNAGYGTHSRHWKSSKIGNHAGHSQTTTSDTLQTCRPRSKSARKKQKLSMPSSSIMDCSQEKLRTSSKTCSKFFVPAYGQHKNGGYQDQKHFGLIEGMGGGEEEIERGSTKPHRGRLLELPGSVMPGMWEANVQHNADVETNQDGEIQQEELQALSLSLRHNSTSSTPLERYYNGEESTPHGLVVSMIDPSINRISSFIKQGVFTNEEVDFCIEGEEKVLNNSFLSCLLFVTFDGFTSSSDSTNDAENCSEAMLAKCVWPEDDRDNCHDVFDNGRCHELHMFGGDRESEATGVLFPCKLDFDCQYYILVSHDAKFRISAIDVIFRKPESPQLLSAPHVHLTESILSEHRLNAGSGVGEIMERFVAQQSLKTESEWPDSLEELVTVDVDNSHPVLDADVKDEMFEASTVHIFESNEPTNSVHSDDNLPSAHTSKRDCDYEGEDSEAKGVIVCNCEAVGGINPFTEGHDNGDNNFVFDDPMNYDLDEESSIKDHPSNNDPDREHMVKEDAKIFNAACKDIKTSNQTPTSAVGGIDKTRPGLSSLDEKTSLYSRLSNICRNSAVQLRRESGKSMRKRSLPYNTYMANTQKRLRRASDTSVHATSTQEKSTSRNAKNSSRRATFPSTSGAAVKSGDLKSAAKKSRSVSVVDLLGEGTFPSTSKAAVNAVNYLKSAAKKTRAVAVVDLFGETESLFGCNIISSTDVDHGRKIAATARYSINRERDRMFDQDEVQSSLAFVRSVDDLERFSGANTATIFDDADEASKVLSESVDVTATHRSTADDTNDHLDGTRFVSGEDNPADAHADESSKLLIESSNEYGNHLSIFDDSKDHDGTKFVSEVDNPSDAFDDARSINSICGASFSLASNNDNLAEVGAASTKSVSIAQPFFDIYFGREDEQSTLIPMPSTVVSFVVKSQPFHDQYYGQESDIGTVEEEACTFPPPHSIYFGLCGDSDSSIHSNLELSSSLKPSIGTESQPFHDQYYGQETIIGLEDKYEYACQSLHGICFGLYDDSVSSVPSQLEFISLINPTTNIPHYDYYFGQEAYLSEYPDNDANAETEKRVGRIPICGVQSQPLFVLVLLAGMLSSAL